VSQPLRAPLEIGFDYTRSLGPTLSQFMTALAGRRSLGSRGADGRVHAPPFEYDPATFAPPAELVEVGPEGTTPPMTRADGEPDWCQPEGSVLNQAPHTTRGPACVAAPALYEPATALSSTTATIAPKHAARFIVTRYTRRTRHIQR